MENTVYEDRDSLLNKSLLAYLTFCCLIVTYIGRGNWKFISENFATEMHSHGI